MEINLKDIEQGMPGISSVAGKQHYEACMCCLHRHGHPEKVDVNVDTDLIDSLELIWEDHFTDQVDRTWNDQEYCTEHGAICISALATRHFTDYTIIRRARKGTGIDYWLGRENDLLFQNSARLEVSGIFNGDLKTAKARYKKKVNQTDQSDKTNLPAYISIIEFSTPILIFGRKNL